MTDGEDLEHYESRCAAFDHYDRLPAWIALRVLLEGRPGWYFTLDSDEPLWCFGLEGACRLVAYAVGPEHVHLYDADSDVDILFRITVEGIHDREDLAEWLAANEPAHAGYTKLQVQLGSHLFREELAALPETPEPGTDHPRTNDAQE